MSFHKLLGQEGEKLAEKYLRKLGYTFVCRNYACKAGEIDLVFLDGDDLVFAEVKTMSSKTEEAFGAPGEKVTEEKQRHNTLAASHFLATHREFARPFTPRFDVVEVTLCMDGAHFAHHKNAFEAADGGTNRKLL